MIDDEELLPKDRLRTLIVDMRAEWSAVDGRIDAFEQEFASLARTDDVARRLTTIPGIGALNVTALVAAVGKGEASEHARDLGAWLGWSRGNTLLAASQNFSGSASAATLTCKRC